MDIVIDNLSLALLHFAREQYQESNVLLFGLNAKEHDRSFIDFCIGRNYLYSSDVGQARIWLERSRNTTPVFRWTYYELSRLLGASGEVSAACQQMVIFVGIAIDQSKASEISHAHIEEIVRVAHKAFEYDREGAAVLYDLICTLGVRNYLSELRVVENQLNRGELNKATTNMKRLTDLHTLDVWGHLVSARIQFTKSDHRLGLTTIATVVNSNSLESSVKITAIHTLLSFGLVEAADGFYKVLLKEPKHQDNSFITDIGGVEFRLNLLRGNHEQLLKDCQTPGFLERIPNWICVESLFSLTRSEVSGTPSRLMVIHEIERFLEDQGQKTLGSILSLFQSYRHRRLWDKVTHLEAEIEADQLFEHHDVLLCRFECLCSALKIMEAKSFYYKYYSDRQLRQWEACVVMRFLAETKMWAQAEVLLLEFFSNGYHLPGGNSFLLRLCRRFSCHAEVIKKIDMSLPSDRPVQYDHLRTLLVDDLFIKNMPNSLDIDLVDHTRTLSQKNAFFCKPEEVKDCKHASNAGYLCLDKVYFFAALTFLSSFAAHTLNIVKITWFVFLSSDIPECWVDILLNFVEKINVQVHVVKEAEILQDSIIHVEEYGIFTGGNILPSSAFLRIYAAEYISALGRFDRAIYFDSDIVCNQDITSLILRPFEKKLLLARLEETSPEIQWATNQHRLTPLSYFNSGVLAFNLSNCDTRTCILNAIHISQHKASCLIFHDQCALNLAFANQTKFLDPNFNFFVRSSRLDNGDLSSAVLLHFLDQPKPWDLAYESSYRATWLRYAGTVRVLLSNADFNLVVQASN